MAQNTNDYSFLNNIDQKVAWAMFILASALTAGAFALNKVAAEDCRVTHYIYCGPTDDGHH